MTSAATTNAPAGTAPMARLSRSLRAGLVAAALSCAATAAMAQTIPGIAARVNGAEITNFRLERHFEDYLKNQRRNISSMINPRVYKKLKREALDQLIERELLWQASQAEGVVVGDDELQAALKQMEAQIKDRAAHARRLALAGFDDKSYAEYVRQELAGTKFLLRKSSDGPTVSDDEVAAFYKGNLHRYEQPETVRARHILVKVAQNATAEVRSAALARIDAVRAELAAGGDFAELARRHSEDNSALDGGDLGAVPRGRMVKPFEEALFALAPGQVSDVVQTVFGYHLIKAEARTAPSTVPLDEVREGIRTRLLAEKRTDLARQIVARLKAAADIQLLVNLD